MPWGRFKAQKKNGYWQYKNFKNPGIQTHFYSNYKYAVFHKLIHIYFRLLKLFPEGYNTW